MIDTERFFVLYFVLLLGPLGGLWIAAVWRDRKLRAAFPKRRLFRCKKCRHFYESDEAVEKLPCPVCDQQNERLTV